MGSASALDNAWFAQNSRSNALNELPIQSHRKSSIADRRGISVAGIEPRRSSSRRSRKHARHQSVSSTEASWFLTLPEKLRKKQFTREEQVVLAARLRESVILDAADEAIYKASRRASRNPGPLLDLSTPSTPTSGIDSPRYHEEPASSMAAEMYESFRWMDEEEDLDLRLALDDYHANLDGVVIPTPSSNRRPSFRRQMSITKMPFGRNSISSLGGPRSPKFEPPNLHSRNKSRTLSLIAPKHVPKASVTSIDPNAAHYQDPEARLKLRVYLASPQKFDEAIEFGFPSMDGIADGADKENKPPKRSSKDIHRTKKSLGGSEIGQSFLADDTASLFEDDVSMVDPESPLTPLGDMGFRSPNPTSGRTTAKSSKGSSDYAHLGITKPVVARESYTQAMAGNREMTLRMTLTRPDLRADENAIYSWQAVKSPLREDPLPLPDEKLEVKGPFGGSDGWGPAEKENGVVKRLWNKMKSSQKKAL
ncbi:hypothetical protein BDZ45DRAFT_701814 [Acephala macrosclerotiorum]|nr:hypothetical protein BDZ45DRAFT_701814 [Acephala macrosclerotiorum]